MVHLGASPWWRSERRPLPNTDGDSGGPLLCSAGARATRRGRSALTIGPSGPNIRPEPPGFLEVGHGAGYGAVLPLPCTGPCPSQLGPEARLGEEVGFRSAAF